MGPRRRWPSIGRASGMARSAPTLRHWSSARFRRGLFAADYVDLLDHAVFDGYLAGLAAAGWRGDPAPVRLGFAAAIALRWFQLHGVLRLLANPDIVPFRG